MTTVARTWSLFLGLGFLSLVPPAHGAGGGWALEAPLGGQPLPPGSTISRLLAVTSDRDSEIHLLGVIQDQARLPIGLFLGSNRSSSPTDGISFRIEDVAAPGGIALFRSGDKVVVYVEGSLDEARVQGRLQLRYLTNGLFMTYKTCEFYIRSRGREYWMENAYTGARVTQARILTSFLGVDTIQGICPR